MTPYWDKRSRYLRKKRYDKWRRLGSSLVEISSIKTVSREVPLDDPKEIICGTLKGLEMGNRLMFQRWCKNPYTISSLGKGHSFRHNQRILTTLFSGVCPTEFCHLHIREYLHLRCSDFRSTTVPTEEDLRDSLLENIQREVWRPITTVRNRKERLIYLVRLETEGEVQWRWDIQ